MIAAIYARKSTEQAEAQSVTRQVENAKTFAAAKGWATDDDYVFMDDGISGAETSKLVAKQKLTTLAPSKAFQVVIMQAQDRFSRRDGHEAFGELKQLAKHVQIWFYAKGERFTFGDFKSNITGILEGEFAAEYRRAIAAKTREAMLKKARDGHVTGGRVFGYENVRVGTHVERRINDAEADVIRDIYRRYADGEGYKQIAHALNAQKLPSPRPQRNRPAGWDPGTVHAVLRRPIYRGTVVYNKTIKRDDEGSRFRGRQPKRPDDQIIRIEKPELRLIDEATIAEVDARLDQRRTAYLRNGHGQLLGRPRGASDGKRLLAGFLMCDRCGATFEAVRDYYVCSGKRRKGVCDCPLMFPVGDIDQLILDKLDSVALSPAFIDHVLGDTFAAATVNDHEHLMSERQRLTTEIANLTKAIATGGDIPALAEALRERDRQLKKIDVQIATPVVLPDREQLRAALEQRMDDWRTVLRGPHVAQARVVLQHLIELPIRIVPNPVVEHKDTPGVLYGDPRAGRWVTGVRPTGLTVGLIQKLASPTGSIPFRMLVGSVRKAA